MRQDATDDVGERPVPVVVVQLVGNAVVVRDIKIGPAVVVIIPPGGGMAAPLAADPGPLGHIGERSIAVVVEEAPALAVRMLRVVEEIGGNIDIEPAVAVVVAKGRHDGRIHQIQPVGVGHLLERPVPLVDIEEIRGVPPADINVQEPVVIHVGKGHPVLPDAGRRALVSNAGLLRHILELEIAEIVEQPAALGLAHDEDVRQAVVVIIPDGHPGPDRSLLEFLMEIGEHPGIVVIVRGQYAGLLRGELDEHGLPARMAVRREQPFGDAARRIRRPRAGAGKHRRRQHRTTQEEARPRTPPGRGSPCNPRERRQPEPRQPRRDSGIKTQRGVASPAYVWAGKHRHGCPVDGGAERLSVADGGGPSNTVAAPDGQRTRMCFGGFESGYPKKQAGEDWL